MRREICDTCAHGIFVDIERNGACRRIRDCFPPRDYHCDFYEVKEEPKQKQNDSSLVLKMKRIDPDVPAPVKGSSGAAGWDLYAASMSYDAHTDTLIYGTGFAFEIPRGYVGLLCPRSSVYRTGMIMPYSIGVVDSDYRGEVKAMFRGVELRTYSMVPPYAVGERCCQLVVVPCPEMDIKIVPFLSETERGEGGYGSTGRK